MDDILVWELEDLRWVAIASTYWGPMAAEKVKAPGIPRVLGRAMSNSQEKMLESRNKERTHVRTIWEVEAFPSFTGAGSCDQCWGRGA